MTETTEEKICVEKVACPLCGKGIDHLEQTTIEKEQFNVTTYRGELSPNKPELNYDFSGDGCEILMQVYTCPECKKPVCLTDEDALTILSKTLRSE